ncbi:MAG: molybdopterin molybdotransferase MoeA [Pseudomonadota bacterium]
MISRTDAMQRIQAVTPLTASEIVPLEDGVGRVLSAPIIAGHSQPPDRMSAMDGYAVRSSDAALGRTLTVIGEAAAGHPFAGTIGAGESVRVFTGSVIPAGADHVIIQEDVARAQTTIGTTIEIIDAQVPPRHIRAAGIDFAKDDVLIAAGERLSPRQLSICAAANHASLNVVRQPVVALLANGDELKRPGSDLGPGEIIASNEYSLAALIAAWGGRVINLGIAPDDREAIRARIESATDADLFVPVGGASVGDHDHMKTVFAALGFAPIFSKIAVRPGKPTWMSKGEGRLVLGLPGNPASALVCAHLFLKPLVQRLLGISDPTAQRVAKLTAPLSANGRRESYLRGRFSRSEDGEVLVTPADNQDSSLLSPFITADALIHRELDAPALAPGDRANCVILD